MEEFKIMTLNDLEDVLTFEMGRIPGEGIEKNMQSWHAPWRREALGHYLPLGWSLIKRSNGGLRGYILCQPVLFFQGFTQTLWIEHVSAEDAETARSLLEGAYRWARDKHFQKVYFQKSLPFAEQVTFAPVDEDGELMSLKTTKM